MPTASGKDRISNSTRLARRGHLRTCLIVSLTLAAFAAGGCGASNQKFSGGEADRALAALDALEAAVSEGHCTSATSRVNALIGQAQTVNRDRPDLGAAYAQSVEQLQRLVATECRERKSEPTEPVTGKTGQTGATEPTPEPTAPPNPQPTDGGTQPTPPVSPEPQPTGGGDNQTGGVSPQ
ncbi:MAG: hypothetical protein HY827_09210 [Actinobacteria bacterium]|nr:hypothetical protein [Actinomycetota bacterium]